MSNFPTELDPLLPTPGAGESLGGSSPTHPEHHTELEARTRAIQLAVGKSGSADTASIEYRLAGVIAAADAAASAAADAAADAISALANAALASSDLADHEADTGAHDIAATVATAIAAHESALDPHGGYALEVDLGTAAFIDAGTAVGDLVQVQAGGALPALDASALLNLPASGVTDHGALTGLADDDHTQYHTDARGDARYAPIAKGVTGGDSHNHDGGDGAQIAYASLSGLPTLGSAAAAATGDFEPSGAVSTHNAVSTAHGISAWGATLVDDADANTARSTLGLGTAATTASTAYATSTQGANADAHNAASAPHAGHSTPATLASAVSAHASGTDVHAIASVTGLVSALAAKAPTASPTFTGTVGGITAAMVGAPTGSGNSTGTNTGNETTTTIGALLNGATSKTTPVDADHIGLMDSAAANIWKKLSWANIKTTLSSTFVTLAGATQNIAGKIGMGVAPTAVLHLKAGTATATTAPLKFTAGTKLTTPEAGALEFDGANYTVTTGTNVRRNLSTEDFVIATNGGMFTNGYGTLGDNTGLPSHTFDATDIRAGVGAFRVNGSHYPTYGSQRIPIDPEAFYNLSLYAKSGDAGGGNYNASNLQHIGVVCYDIDNLQINPFHGIRNPVGSQDTYLAAALNIGDTTISLVNASGWDNASTFGYVRQMCWFGYQNSKGFVYPDFTYTRNNSYELIAAYRTPGLWAVGGISGNTITLTSPWPGPAIASGTAVRNVRAGPTNLYCLVSNSAVPNVWTNYECTIGGVTSSGLELYKFFPGTATISFLHLVNYHDIADNNVRLNGISVSNANAASKIGIGDTYKALQKSALPANGLVVEGNAGFGTSAPSAKIHAIATTEQLRCGYDAANYLGSTTNSAGVTTFNLVGTAPAAKWAVSDATTNAIHDVATFSKNSTGAGAAGLGARIVFAAKSSTTVDTPQAGISSEWVNATHATRTSRLKLSANDYGGARDGIRIESDGAVPRLGFYGATAVVKPTALTATVSAAPAGGTGTADGGWDTSINRDLAIATINNLKTRVDQLETKLQALGLLT